MPDITPQPSPSSNSAAPTGPYLARLDDEDREAYQNASGAPDLTDEIRLIRVVLSRLTADILANKQVIGSVFNALIRAVSFQAGRSSDADSLEKALQDASEQVLNEASADVPSGGPPEEKPQ